MTTGKTMKTLLALAAALAVASAAEATTTTINKGATKIYAGKPINYFGNGTEAGEVVLNNHGTLLAYTNSDSTVTVTIRNQDSDKNQLQFYIDLGPNPGDQGVFIMSNAVYRLYQKGDVRIGGNGGGDQAKLVLYNCKPSDSTKLFKSLELTVNAATEAASFQAVEIASQSFLALMSGIINNNAKPLEIAFTSYDPSSSYSCLYKYANSAGLFYPVAGDIVLRSFDIGTEGYSTNTFIKLSMGGASGSTTYFFPNDGEKDNLTGVLRTEGPGSVSIDLSNSLYSRKSMNFELNAAKVAWNHAGDFILRCDDVSVSDDNYLVKRLRVSADNALPYGQQTGNIILRSNGSDGVTTANYPYPVLDLTGTVQRVNGIVMQEGGGKVSNSATTEAVLVFGSGDADGEVSGVNITNKVSIRCVKTGTGTLTLDGSAFNTLSGDGGAIHVKSATYVDTLALTNVVLTFENDDTSLLTVREDVSGRASIPLADRVASNCISKLPMDGLYSGSTFVKDGSGVAMYMTPNDAMGAGLSVNAGVLRFGGEECTNAIWRLSLKKANNDGRTYTFNYEGYDPFSVFVRVAIGSINFFTSEGLGALNMSSDSSTNSTYDTAEKLADTGDDGRGKIISKNAPFKWGTSDAQAHGVDTDGSRTGKKEKDPIFSGGGSYATAVSLFGGPNTKSNVYDVAANGDNCSALGIVRAWSSCVAYTNAANSALDPDDPSTWEVLTWKVKKVNSAVQAYTSYSLRRPVNWTNSAHPYVTDWRLESSNDGRNWELMDERSGQRWWSENEDGSTGLYAQYNYTYNNHVPYLFKSRNANWRFDTFGKVSVAAGATLDLSEIPTNNIAFNALAVDCTAGAGTITHFAPAENGALYLENVPADQTATFRLPITIENWIDPAKMQTWSVYVNGELVENARIDIYDGGARVRRYKGIVLIIQ